MSSRFIPKGKSKFMLPSEKAAQQGASSTANKAPEDDNELDVAGGSEFFGDMGKAEASGPTKRQLSKMAHDAEEEAARGPVRSKEDIEASRKTAQEKIKELVRARAMGGNNISDAKKHKLMTAKTLTKKQVGAQTKKLKSKGKK